jgi:hypothetical protein
LISADSQNTIVGIASDFYLKIPSTYPSGVKPKWAGIVKAENNDPNYYGINAVVDLENYTGREMKNRKVNCSLFITERNNRPILVFGDSYADIVTDNSRVYIESTPKTFKLANFRLFRLGKYSEIPIEESKYNAIAGGARGIIELSMTQTGHVIMNLQVEYYQKPTPYKSGGISFKYILHEFKFTNLMPTDLAQNNKLEFEKQRVKDSIRAFELKKERDIEDDEFEVKIENSLRDIMVKHNKVNSENVKKCIYQTVEYDFHEPQYVKVTGQLLYTKEGVPIGTDDYYEKVKGSGGSSELVAMRNNCNQDIIIKGIRKLISKRGTVYYEDVSIKISGNSVFYGVVNIEENYYPQKAEIGSYHFYTNRIIQ